MNIECHMFTNMRIFRNLYCDGSLEENKKSRDIKCWVFNMQKEIMMFMNKKVKVRSLMNYLEVYEKL